LELISSIKKLKNQLPNLIGVDLNSKFEIKPGLKDINRVKKFIKSIKNENT
jgi:phosphoribosylanthranilate isomerase